MKYKSFYHLHIPRTGGRFIINNVLSLLYPYMREDGIDVINEVPIDQPMAHACWHPKINDDTYILSTFRDPLTHISSLFYLQVIAAGMPKQYYPDHPTYNEELFDKKIFINYLNGKPEYQYITNSFQSKNLLYIRPFLRSGYDYTIDADKQIIEVLDRAKRINLFIRMEDIPVNPMLIAEKIIYDMGLSVSIDTIKKEYENRLLFLKKFNEIIVVPKVSEFANSFDDEEKKHIWVKIRTDYHVYSTDELFYKFDTENVWGKKLIK